MVHSSFNGFFFFCPAVLFTLVWVLDFAQFEQFEQHLFFAHFPPKSRSLPIHTRFIVIVQSITMSSVHAVAAFDGKKVVEDYTYEIRDLCAHDVEIKITHCGVCASDVHLVDQDWGSKQDRPLVPGHEIVGTVVRAGPESVLKVGQRVGSGWQVGSCGDCVQCNRGVTQHCPKMEQTMQGLHSISGTRNYGGFADRIMVDSRFAYVIPEELNSAEAAPLLCAGLTVFSPLKRLGGGAGSRVGVVGIGGLGHLGVQFSKALGHKVTAISHSPDKEEFARKLGADEFLNSGDAKAMEEAANSLDFLLVTISANINWDQYLSLLDVEGTACLCGIPTKKLEITALGLVFRRISVTGSLLSSPDEAREMLDLAAKKNIASIVTELPFKQANESLDRVREGKPRFRDVLVMDQ